MKYYESHYEEYLQSSKRKDIHQELQEVRDGMPKSINQLANLIVYGPSGSGKYTQVIRLLEHYSPSHLKYDKKITMQTEKNTYSYRISDIHSEIDMSLLGCESKRMWNDCFFQIVDIVSMKPDKAGIIVCKNFHAIHSELLEVFYSYMQHCHTLSIHLVFILVTDHVSFMPNNIIECCKIVSVKRPDASLYEPYKVEPESVLNLKEIQSFQYANRPEEMPSDVFNIVCDHLIERIEHPETLEFADFRDQLYDILLYGLDVTDCIWYILYHLVKTGKLHEPKTAADILSKTYVFLKYYNNNYRPIYHLESIFFYIITKIGKK
jgi:Cdc6-like AAA superfamily ATPase